MNITMRNLLVLLVSMNHIPHLIGMQVTPERKREREDVEHDVTEPRAAHHFVATGPMPFKELKKQHKEDSEEWLAGIKAILDYHTLITKDGLTGYELELKDICDKIVPSIEQAKKEYTEEKKPIFILDADETLISNRDLSKATGFKSKAKADKNDPFSPYNFRVAKKCTKITPMTAFCTLLREMGIKPVVISSRRGDGPMYKAIRENLAAVGIEVDDDADSVHLTPLDVFGKMSPAVWKESVREKLDTTYHILGCIGDDPADWSGRFTGDITINLPNYLY